MRVILVLNIILFIPVAVFAQMYTGKVVDGTTQEPLAGVKILNQSGEATVSQSDGTFQINSENSRLDFSFPGYQEKKQELTAGENVVTMYGYDVYEMDQIVVTAEQDKELIKVSKQKLSREAITQAPVALFPDVAKVVQLLPGVTTNQEFSSLLFVRGGEPNEVLSILDDMVILNPYIWGGMISIYNPNLVESVDFYSGGFSAEWPQAMSGILKVKNKVGNPDEYKGFVDLSATTLDVFLEGPFWGPEASSFMLGLRRTHYDLIVGLFYSDDNIVFPYFYDGQFKVNLPFDNHMITVNSIYSFEGMKMEIQPEEGYASANATDSEFMYKNLSVNTSISSDYRLSENLSVLTLLGCYYNQGNFSYDDAFTPFDMDREQVILQLRHVWQWDTGVGHVLRSGFYHFPANGEATYTSSVKLPTGNNTWYEKTQETKVETDWLSFTGWFVQDEMTLIDDLLYANPSCNVQYFTATSQWLVNPRVMLKIQPMPDWEITMATGLYSQYPISASQIDDELGNPGLNAQEAIHYVLGNKIYFTENLSLQIDGYYKDYRNLIVSDPDPDLNYTNHERGRAYGIDMMLKKELGGKWDGWLTYSWVNSDRRIDWRTDPTTLGMPASNTPIEEWYTAGSERPHTLNLVLNYNINDKFKLALTQKFASGKVYTPITGADYQPALNEYIPNYGKYNSARYPDYMSTDIKFTMPLFGLEKGYSYIQITNLFNRANVNSYDYKTDYSGKREISQLPRLIIGGIRWEF